MKYALVSRQEVSDTPFYVVKASPIFRTDRAVEMTTLPGEAKKFPSARAADDYRTKHGLDVEVVKVID